MMRGAWLGGVALVVALAGCSSSSSQADPAAGNPGNGAAMSNPFKQALQRFQREVASAYGKRAGDLKIMPPSDDVVGFDDQKTGDLIPFEATAPGLRVRGFANKTAVVLARSGELGPLFEAAHALDPARSLSAQDLAARIVWMLGPEFRLVANAADYPKAPVPPGVGPPALERSGGGAVLRFFVLQDDHSLPGSPPTKLAAEVACSSSYKAKLVTSPGP